MESITLELPPVDIAIIGAGIAGLSAAVHARMAGFTVRVFERHFLPGGLCTSWKRKGYVFDYSVEWFMGSRKEQGFYRLWKDLGIIDATEFLPIKSFGRYVAADGREFNLYTDSRKLQEHMLSIAPEDAGLIKEFCRAIRKAECFVMDELSFTYGGCARFIRSLPAFSMMMKWSGISTGEWSARFRNELLREALPALIGAPYIPLSGPIIAFGSMHAGNAAYPMEGSLPLARAVEARAIELGADIVYRAGVKRIMVDNDRAAGVELEDGRTQRVQHVVAACDAHTVFETLLEGRIKSPVYQELFEKREINTGLVQVSLGVRLDPEWKLERNPHKVCLPLSPPVTVDGSERPRACVLQFMQNPGMAPKGCTSMVVRFEADYERWKALRAGQDGYKAEKSRIFNETIRALDAHFPGIGARVEASDVATPVTCVRYTGNLLGSFLGWMLTVDMMKKLMAGKKPPREFPELRHFYLIGQWSEPGGGLPPSAKSGRDVIRAIMKTERKKKK